MNDIPVPPLTGTRNAPDNHRHKVVTGAEYDTEKTSTFLIVTATVAVVLMTLLAIYNWPRTEIALLLPVVSIAIVARLASLRLLVVMQLFLWIGIAVLAATGTISNLNAFLGGSAATVVAALSVLERASTVGIYGLRQTTEHEILRTLLSSVPVVLLDDKGNIRRASEAARDMLDVTIKDVTSRPLRSYIRGFDTNAFANASDPSGLIAPVGQNWHLQKQDGSEIAVEIFLSHTPEGPLIRLVDLTPRHTADAQARELHSQLNKVWRLNSLGEMAATLAHELNQPLGAAAAYLHAAQEDMKMAGALGESALRTTDLAKNQMLRAGQIIRRMRELLTMEMRALAKESFSSVVDDVLPILVLTGKDRNIAINTDIVMPDLVRMDRIQIQQALVNLVRNAVEASPNDTQVLISGHPISDRVYEVAVEDSGPGIAPDQVDRVFQPMTTTKSGGMGLGLSVTRTIVESHGGNLKVGTSRWGGARFSFTLTIATQEATQ